MKSIDTRQAHNTGTEQLMKSMNGYMSDLVSEVISYDGDILKLAGDAMMTIWPVNSPPSMEKTTENVIQSVLDIQHKHSMCTTY